ncbi:MAG: hypothetical protein LUE20_04130 [Oscillospiraceae bacterium]|nr:hypothetical protein [Oscillospiraceae bacterium]
MKRILSIILAFALMFSLCGCGESAKGDVSVLHAKSRPAWDGFSIVSRN